MTRWPEAFSRVVPQGDACFINLGFVVPLGDAPMTRWPEAFSRVVPEGDACVITLGLESARYYCTCNVCSSKIYKKLNGFLIVFDSFAYIYT